MDYLFVCLLPQPELVEECSCRGARCHKLGSSQRRGRHLANVTVPQHHMVSMHQVLGKKGAGKQSVNFTKRPTRVIAQGQEQQKFKDVPL
eukprot:356607-Amphidinium_carterae.1